MSFYAFVLVLIASITHAYWNYLAKQANGKTPFIWLIYVVSSIIYLPFVAWLLLKNNTALNWLLLGIGIISAVLRLSYFLILQAGYRKSDLSVVYPLARGSGPLFSTLGAIVLLHEAPTIYSVSGLLLIITGVLIITKLKLTGGMGSRLKAGLVYGCITGFFIGCYTLWDKLAVTGYNMSPVLLIFISNIFGSVVLAPGALKNTGEVKKQLKQYPWHITGVAVLSPFSYILVLLAMQTTPVIYVAPARELSILFGVIMGGRMMNEEDTKRRLFASVFIAGGIFCLAFG